MIDSSERLLLERAFQLAEKGGRATAPNPRVGCVIARNGEVVGEGWHQRLGESHAEAQALGAAGERARGATAFVSLEPCAHEGRTPPCTRAIVAAGVVRVVLGLVDPDQRVAGRGVAALREAGIEVEIAQGDLAAEAERLLEEYLVHRREGRSFALLKCAASLDGRIADREGCSRWITGAAARRHGRRLRERYGAILVGSETVLTDDPLLLPPNSVEEGGLFLRCVLDSTLRTPPTARLLRDVARVPLLLFTKPDAPADRRQRLEDAGAEVVSCAPGEGGLAPRAVLEELARRGVLGVVVEGGGRVHGAFLVAGLADKLHWYLSPKIIGDPAARPSVDWGGGSLADAFRGRIARIERLEEDLLLTVYPPTRGGAGGAVERI